MIRNIPYIESNTCFAQIEIEVGKMIRRLKNENPSPTNLNPWLRKLCYN
jgi:hypothetical protein